jgi:hypothetical protein
VTDHTVSQGEHLPRIALRYGFLDWQAVYQHPNNAELRRRRPNPNVLLPGDKIYVPDIQTKGAACPTGRTHIFRLVGEHCVRIIVKDAGGTPYANAKYQVTIGHEVREGTTDDKGALYEYVRKSTEDAELKLPELGLGWTLKIGYLDPLHDQEQDAPIVTGVKARLKNLGFYTGEVDSNLDHDAKEAMKRFQRGALKRGEPDGDLDAETRNALQQEHGA